MAPQYKLFYFDAPGRGELIRWILAYAGKEFEDVRIKPENWPSLKAQSPYGTMPYLEVDGKQLGQSLAIARYLARQNGLTGADEFEAAKVDALVDYATDAANSLSAIVHETDEAKKTALKEAYFGRDLHQYLSTFERHLQANHNGDGYFVGTKPTWADLGMTVFLDGLVGFSPALLDKYPLLKAHSQRVHELKGIKDWIQKHH